MLPQQPLRFLLADDPGAGKTIMAGREPEGMALPGLMEPLPVGWWTLRQLGRIAPMRHFGPYPKIQGAPKYLIVAEKYFVVAASQCKLVDTEGAE